MRATTRTSMRSCLSLVNGSDGETVCCSPFFFPVCVCSVDKNNKQTNCSVLFTHHRHHHHHHHLLLHLLHLLYSLLTQLIPLLLVPFPIFPPFLSFSPPLSVTLLFTFFFSPFESFFIKTFLSLFFSFSPYSLLLFN